MLLEGFAGRLRTADGGGIGVESMKADRFDTTDAGDGLFLLRDRAMGVPPGVEARNDAAPGVEGSGVLLLCMSSSKVGCSSD